MLHHIDHEISLAQQDLALTRNETVIFLTPPKSSRQRRGASMGLAALTALGLFGGGLAVGGSDSCALRGIFKNCRGQSKALPEMYAGSLINNTLLLINLRNL